MSKRFITVQEACALLDEVSDDEEGELVILSPDQKGDIVHEKKDDEDIAEHQVLEDVAGEVEVFYSSLETSEQEVTERSSRPAKRTKLAKVSWKKNHKLTTPLPHWYSTTFKRNTATTE